MHRSVAEGRFGTAEPEGRASVCAVAQPSKFLFFFADLLDITISVPVWLAHEDFSLTERYREYVRTFRTTGLEADSDAVFRRWPVA